MRFCNQRSDGDDAGVTNCCGLSDRWLSVACCTNGCMSLAGWAKRDGVARVTAYRWLRAGLLPVPARKVGRLILVEDPSVAAGPRSPTAVYARVSSADQKVDLDQQVSRVAAWATAQQTPLDDVVTEVGSAGNGRRRMFLALLGDPSVERIVVDHQDRFCQFGSQYVQAALAAQDRKLVVVDAGEVDDDDLVRDMTEMLAPMWTRLYGKRAAASRAGRAVDAAAAADREAA